MNRSVLLFCLFAYSCATVQAPSGGPRDETPPEVIYTYPDSAQLNVSPSSIEIRFDEFVKTNNANTLLIISPNPSKTPEFSIKKKSLIIDFKDSLLPATTYNIMINGAIQDINEGNPLEDYQLTFSTGSFLDSQSYSAVIIDALSRELCEDCAMFMYRTNQDSLPLLRRPDYLGKSNSNGKVVISFLPADSFTVHAIRDENKSLKIESKEYISNALRINSVTENSDTILIFPYFDGLAPVPSLLNSNFPGIVTFAFDKPCFQNRVELWQKSTIPGGDSVLLSSSFNNSLDTLKAMLIPHGTDSIELRLIIDTVHRNYELSYPGPGLRKMSQFTYKEKGILEIESVLEIDIIDLNLFVLTEDSLLFHPDSILKDSNKLYIYFEHRDHFVVHLKKGAIRDIHSNRNIEDSSIVSYDPNEHVSFTLKMNVPDSSNYLIQLLTEGRVVQQFSTVKEFYHTFRNLKPGTYRIRIIDDINDNGVWDPGDILSGKNPEPVYLSEPVELRPSWDKELIITSL